VTDKFRAPPFHIQEVTPAHILAETQPNEPMSIGAAERRIAEIQAHITNIGRQLDDKSVQRKRAWAGDPHAAWRKAAMQARDELRLEEKSLRLWIERQEAPRRAKAKVAHAREEVERQEIDKSTRDARKLAQRSGEAQLWDLYLKVEVALLEILKAHGLTALGPLGHSLLYSAQILVPDWYRQQWLRTVYGTTWGRQAESQNNQNAQNNPDGGT